MSSQVEVVDAQCARVAQILKCSAIPETREEFDISDFHPDEGSNFLLCVVAICHQTQNLRGIVNARELVGWDYLSTKFREAARNGHFPLDRESLRSVSANQLGSIFSYVNYNQTPSDLAGRAALIRDLGNVMMRQNWNSLHDIYAACDNCAISGSNSFFDHLSAFAAFKDPVKKKFLYLLALTKTCLGWWFKDAMDLPSPVDYHEVRGHLRIGTIKISSQDLLEKIRDRSNVSPSEDIAIRQAVQSAIARIANEHGGTDPMTLHYIFWNLFRNVCLRETPQCNAVTNVDKVPRQYHPFLTGYPVNPSCPFKAICCAFSNGEFLFEHFHQSDWY